MIYGDAILRIETVKQPWENIKRASRQDAFFKIKNLPTV